MSLIPGITNAAPAIVMAAGVVPMLAPSAPDYVRYGGACLMGIALILADLKSGKKMGYTDKIVNAVRKIPGLENADSGTVIGALTLGASASFISGETMNMAENGITAHGLLRVGYNTINYPLSAAFDFQRTRLLMQHFFGRELAFSYKDADGIMQKTTPIPTSRLLQQLALISGASGIITYGTMVDAATIQFSGAMFALSNGMNIAGLVKQPIREVTRAKLEALRTRLTSKEVPAGDGEAVTVQQQWQEAQNAFTADSPVLSSDAPVAPAEIKVTAEKIVDAIAPIIAQAQLPPDKQTHVGR